MNSDRIEISYLVLVQRLVALDVWDVSEAERGGWWKSDEARRFYALSNDAPSFVSPSK